jgi:hypothetical protein
MYLFIGVEDVAAVDSILSDTFYILYAHYGVEDVAAVQPGLVPRESVLYVPWFWVGLSLW